MNMTPHNLFDSDCEVTSVGHFFTSFLSNSLNTLTPMCNDSAVSPMCNDGAVSPMCNDSSVSPMCNDSSGPRVYSPTYPMNNQSSPSAAGNSCVPTFKSRAHPASATSSPTAVTPERRPPLNPIKHVKSSKPSHRNRKKLGLSVNVPHPSSDPHRPPRHSHDGCGAHHPPPISCARNIELRRKSLSERHFFRPVSDDDESAMGRKQ